MISLQPNASKIVSQWGLDDVLATAEPTTDTSFRIFNSDGNLVQEIPSSTAIYGSERRVYHRRDLHNGLREAAIATDWPGEPVRIRTGAAVVHCDPVNGIVRLKDGEEVAGDLIIGADGIRSVARESVLKKPVASVPTGLSAYRILIDAEDIGPLSCSKDVFDINKPCSTMVLAHDRRVILGPGRGHKVLGLVALLPDESLNEISHGDSWTTPGTLDKLLESFTDFPEWLLDIFKAAPDIALWQLRDTEPLDKWVDGRTILVGDAAHAMLPTQGQGASQSIEDAEALGAFFSDLTGRPSYDEIQSRLNQVFKARYDRASLIQSYSRQAARPATDEKSKKVTMRMDEFMDYNNKYSGAKDWLVRNTAKEIQV